MNGLAAAWDDILNLATLLRVSSTVTQDQASDRVIDLADQARPAASDTPLRTIRHATQRETTMALTEKQRALEMALG